MRFNLIFVMNLAAIATIGSPSPVSLLTPLQSQLLQHCHQFVDRLRKFVNCNVPETFHAKSGSEALPYMCLLTLNQLAEMCSENDSDLWERFQIRYNKIRSNGTICPFHYATKTNHLRPDLNSVADYFANEKYCDRVCYFSNDTLDDCIVMASVNELSNAKVEKGGLEDLPRKAQSPIRSDPSQNATKQIVANPKFKLENVKGEVYEPTREELVTDHSETVSKTEGKMTVKTETTSDCVTKDKDKKPVNEKVDAKTKSTISDNSKQIPINNSSNIVHNDTIKTPKKEGANNVNPSGSNTINSNNNNNEELQPKVEQDVMNRGKIDLIETEMPPLKDVNDGIEYSLPSGKKDFPYSPTMKGSLDEAEDDDNNEEMSRSDAQLQNVISDTEYDSGRVPNPKELYNGDGLFQAEDSHFSAYFLMTISIIIIGYIIYHTKNKIVAYALEGRRGRNGRRRPTSSASYRKLDCNLEEAIASNPSHASVTNVVY